MLSSVASDPLELSRQDFEKLVGSAKFPLRIDIRHNNQDTEILETQLRALSFSSPLQTSGKSQLGDETLAMKETQDLSILKSIRPKSATTNASYSSKLMTTNPSMAYRSNAQDSTVQVTLGQSTLLPRFPSNYKSSATLLDSDDEEDANMNVDGTDPYLRDRDHSNNSFLKAGETIPSSKRSKDPSILDILRLDKSSNVSLQFQKTYPTGSQLNNTTDASHNRGNSHSNRSSYLGATGSTNDVGKMLDEHIRHIEDTVISNSRQPLYHTPEKGNGNQDGIPQSVQDRVLSQTKQIYTNIMRYPGDDIPDAFGKTGYNSVKKIVTQNLTKDFIHAKSKSSKNDKNDTIIQDGATPYKIAMMSNSKLTSNSHRPKSANARSTRSQMKSTGEYSHGHSTSVLPTVNPTMIANNTAHGLSSNSNTSSYKKSVLDTSQRGTTDAMTLLQSLQRPNPATLF